MSLYRVYEYPSSDVPYKHIYLKRGSGKCVKDDLASVNSASILESLSREEKFSQALSRARRNIVDLILCNGFEYFCTFTFSDEKINRFDRKEVQKKLTKFFNNFKVRYASDFRYLVVPEKHRNGAIHLHGVCKGFPSNELVMPDVVYKRDQRTGEIVPVPNTPHYMDWPRYREAFGWFSCSPIRSQDRCAFYVSKYITKDMVDVPKGTRLYFRFSGIEPP